MPSRDQTTKTWGCVFVAASIVAIASTVFYVRSHGNQTGMGFWLGLPIVALGAAFGTIAAVAVPLRLFVWVRSRLGMSERYTLAQARKAAGADGEETHHGPITIWRSGPSDPSSMLTKQLERARAGVSRVIGQEIELSGVLRVYFFDRLEAYTKFHERLFMGPPSSNTATQGRPITMVAMCDESLPYLLQEPEAAARERFCVYCLDEAFRFQLPLWLHFALVNVVSGRGDRDEFARLDRNVLASLKEEAAFAAVDLFEPTGKALQKLGRNNSDLERFGNVMQFAAQSWSVGEYLSGSGSTGQRRDRFGAFLRELQSDVDQEEAFLRHFRFGFEQLLEDWRKWALERGEAPHVRPPAGMRDALIDRVIPTVLNTRTKLSDRIWAVRAMGSRGFALGADRLIELLRSGSEIPKEELVWALECISGLSLGDDALAWDAWWESVPEEAKG